jgi:hypothetical protein
MGESMIARRHKSAKKRLRSIAVAAVALGLVGAGQSASVASVSTTKPSTAQATPAAALKPMILPQVVAPTGSLSIQVTGVPGGKTAAIKITGPAGYVKTLRASGTLTAMAPGSYTISGPAIGTTAGTYYAVPSASTVKIVSGKTGAVSVRYGRTTIPVTVSGVPRGAKGSVRITGPAGFAKSVSTSAAFYNVRPGVYTISGNSFRTSAGTYYAVLNSARITVAAGRTVPVTAKYGRTILTTSISGVPAGKKAAVRVSGPGFAKTISNNTVFANVRPGTYKISGTAIATSAGTYYAVPSKPSYSVSNGFTVPLGIKYGRTSLKVLLGGVPANAVAQVKITGPNRYSKTVKVTGSYVLQNLPAGRYTVVTGNATVASGTGAGTYYASGATTANVTAGVAGSANVKFLTTSLKVDLAELPTGQAAKVTVTGPGTFKRTITFAGSYTFKGIVPGQYSVQAEKVTRTTGAQSGVYSPTVSGPVTIKVGGAGRLVATYHDVIAVNVESPKASEVVDVGPAPAAPGDTGTVVLSGAQYAVGDVVTAGISEAAPDGLLVRLVAQTAANGAEKTFTTEAATVQDVVKRGSFAATVAADVALNDAVGQAATSTAQFRARALNPFSKNLRCTNGVSMTIDARVDGTITADVKAEWDFWNPDRTSVSVEAKAQLKGALEAAVNGRANCVLATTDILAKPVKLPNLQFVVGGVVVVISNSLQFTAQGSADSSATLSTSAEAVANTSVGATLTKTGLSTHFNPPTTSFTYERPNLTANGNAELYLGARLDMKFYGIAGPNVTAAIGSRISADINADPWWKFEGKMKAGAGIDPGKLGFLGLRPVSKDDVIDKTWPIGDAGGPLHAPPATDPANPGGTPTTPPIQDGSPGAPALRKIASYGVNDQLRCSLFTKEDVYGEFYGSEACGTFAEIGGQMYGPSRIPAGGVSVTPWTPVSQTTTGAGTALDPTVVTTVVAAGETGVQLVETDRWAADGSSIGTDLRVTNRAGTAQDVRVSRGFDCYLGDRDSGTGELNLGGQLVGCLRTVPTGEVITLRLQALTSGATVTEGRFSDIWAAIDAKADLNNSCLCSSEIDNALAISWLKNVPANSSLVLRSEISMTRP